MKQIHKKNQKLKKQLLEKGYYIQSVGQRGEIDYLIVSCAEPKNQIKVNKDKSNLDV